MLIPDAVGIPRVASHEPMSLSPLPAVPTAPGRQPGPRRMPAIEQQPLNFTGSGSDYFRLWFPNLLLIVVTLGLYMPWARRRRAQYFFRNTKAGADPLDFTASNRSMVIGFLLVVLAFGLVYAITFQGFSTAVSAVILLVAAITPAVWRSAMRFRMGNTTWRTVPFHFHATTRETYVAAWPLIGVAVFVVSLQFLMADTSLVGLRTVAAPGPLGWALGISVMLLAAVLFIRIRFNFLQLQMTRTSLGGQMGRFKAGFSEFFRVGLICLGVGVLIYLALFTLGLAAASGLASWSKTTGRGGSLSALAPLAVFLVPLLLAPAAITQAAWEAMVFRTIWNHTGLSDLARSKCSLQTQPFVQLRARNVLLTLVTLGLYRPFAVVSEYRMKVDSVRLYTRGNLPALAYRLGSINPVRASTAATGQAESDSSG